PVSSALQSTYGGGSLDAFIVELDPASAVVFSTYLGGSGSDSPSLGVAGIAVDSSGGIYVTGSTSSSDFPGVNAGSIQSTNGGGGDAFIAKLSPQNTPVSTPPGPPVTFPLNKNAVIVTFQGGVTTAGATAASNLGANCPAAPNGFQQGTPPVCYGITTTAQFAGMVQVCISDPSI